MNFFFLPFEFFEDTQQILLLIFQLDFFFPYFKDNSPSLIFVDEFKQIPFILRILQIFLNFYQSTNNYCLIPPHVNFNQPSTQQCLKVNNSRCENILNVIYGLIINHLNLNINTLIYPYLDIPLLIVDFLPNVKNSRKFSIQSSSSSSQNSLIYSEPFEIDAYEQKYTELERVGEGAHGLVKLCREKEPMTGNIYVVKIIRSDQEEIVQNEYNLLQAIEHQNIIKAREMFVSKRQGLIRIIFEYEKCVSLAAFLKQRTLNEVECKKIILQLLSAIEYLHTQRIVHRDINPSNIVINEDLHLKLIDFGVAKQTEVYDDMIYSPTGTHQYQAPQVLDNQPYNSRIDIYSTGLVLTEMLLGKLPNSKLLKDMEEIKALFQSKQTISQNCINFVCQMLEENPEKRLNIKKFKDEAWLVPVIRIENLPNREDTQLSQASESPSKRYLTPKQFQNTENKENKNIRLQQSLTEQSKRFNNQFNSTSIFKIYQ